MLGLVWQAAITPFRHPLKALGMVVLATLPILIWHSARFGFLLIETLDRDFFWPRGLTSGPHVGGMDDRFACPILLYIFVCAVRLAVLVATPQQQATGAAVVACNSRDCGLAFARFSSVPFWARVIGQSYRYNTADISTEHLRHYWVGPVLCPIFCPGRRGDPWRTAKLGLVFRCLDPCLRIHTVVAVFVYRLARVRRWFRLRRRERTAKAAPCRLDRANAFCSFCRLQHPCRRRFGASPYP